MDAKTDVKGLHSDHCWRDFKAGDWCRAIDVRDFIVRNVTPYDGDETFLVGPPTARRRSGRSCNLISKRSARRACWTSMRRRLRPSLRMTQARSTATTR